MPALIDRNTKYSVAFKLLPYPLDDEITPERELQCIQTNISQQDYLRCFKRSEPLLRKILPNFFNELVFIANRSQLREDRIVRLCVTLSNLANMRGRFKILVKLNELDSNECKSEALIQFQKDYQALKERYKEIEEKLNKFCKQWGFHIGYR